jgi:Holliday junction resolvasome RuvABC endonuclease subunit
MTIVRVLAIDPALRHGGHCLIEGDPWNEGQPPYGWKVTEVGSYVLPKEHSHGRCFSILRLKIDTLIRTRKPHAVVIEGPGPVDYGQNRSLQTAHTLAASRAMCQLAAHECGVPSFLPDAGKVKLTLATSFNARKTETMASLRLLGLYDGRDEDEADSVMVGFAGMAMIRSGEIILPEGARV